jgi:hypothetical protein
MLDVVVDVGSLAVHEVEVFVELVEKGGYCGAVLEKD